MKKPAFVLLTLLIFSVGFAPHQRTITGVVTSADDGGTLPGVSVIVKGTGTHTITDTRGRYSIATSAPNPVLVFTFVGYKTQEIKTGSAIVINVSLQTETHSLSEVMISGNHKTAKRFRPSSVPSSIYSHDVVYEAEEAQQDWNTEEYDALHENIFHGALQNPLSTFSIDVDAASYSNIRRFINNGQRPPKDAVRIEEMVNYFTYDYEQPNHEHPFAIHTEISAAPWNTKHQLVHVGLQGKIIPTEALPPSNLVFLIDVSGSMSDPNKLPLLKASFKMLVEKLRPQDSVAMVVYAGAAGLVLPPTSGADKDAIIQALNSLEAGGSTAGGAGINLAYAVAKEHFIAEGNNRVILATDGDFNIGASSNAEMERLIEEKRKDGIYLTVLGYGMGNYKDSKMEKLANKGNGNYAYIDNLTEARKVLVNEFGGTLFTIAKDVKLQVEFNPAKVKAYRLIGYENRMLRNEDFNNDKKDAGELGSGHSVTALYEIIPVGVDSKFFNIDDLKYQQQELRAAAKKSGELLTVKFRYKDPRGHTSKLIVHPLMDSGVRLSKTSDNFRWSASVAAFGMLLRDSEYSNHFSYDEVVQLAESARGRDEAGYRVAFINMVKSYGAVASR